MKRHDAFHVVEKYQRPQFLAQRGGGGGDTRIIQKVRKRVFPTKHT